MPPSASPAPEVSEVRAKPRVLVVDDEPQVLLAIDDLLSDDYAVTTVGSGARALEVMHEQRDIAVVLSDQRMPKMSGDELLERAQALSSASRILFTGFADLTAVVRAVNHGKIFAYVTKPWQTDDLLLLIRKAVEHFELSSELRSERQLLHDLMDSAQDGIFFKDRDLRYLRGNRAFAREYGPISPEALIGRKHSELSMDPRAAEEESEQAEVLRSGQPVLDRLRQYRRDGSRRWYSTTTTPIRNLHEEVVGLVGIRRDVTEREAQAESLARLTRIHAMLGGINGAIVHIHERAALLNEACRIAVEHGKLTRALAIDCSETNQQLQLLAASGDAQLALPPELAEWIAGEAAPELARGEMLTRSDLPQVGPALVLLPLCVGGRLDSLLVLIADQFDPQELALLTTLRDNLSLALDHGAQRERLNFLAYYDELTGLAKRELLTDRLTQLLAEAEDTQRPFALIVLDVTRFRYINESLGRSSGDAVLREIARRLRANLEPQALLARFDAHAFALLLPHIEHEAQVVSRVENSLLPAFREPLPFASESGQLGVGCRIGIALCPADGRSADALIRSAEAALKQVGNTGPRYVFCAPGMAERAAAKLSLEARLRRALELEEFVLHYQPKVELESGRVVGLEALVRWLDADGKLTPPASFIPTLEETGLILEMGRWVLQRAAAQFSEWSDRGINPPPIAVNVSAIELAQPDFLSTVDETIRRYPKTCGGIDLEITESVLIDDLGGNIAKLTAVRERGLRVAIDDFGTGYSSLGYLSRLPVDALKVDRSFVDRMGEDPRDMTIVMAIISLAHAMDLKVIAEGSETAAQARILRSLRCDQLQGYFFSRPQPAEQVPSLLSRRLQFDLPVS